MKRAMTETITALAGRRPASNADPKPVMIANWLGVVATLVFMMVVDRKSVV